jgi:lipoprotein-anchoring transpeptidase ErfK/SrfK
MADDLTPVPSTPSASATGRRVARRAQSRKRTRLVAGGALATLVAVVGAVVAFSGGGDPTPRAAAEGPERVTTTTTAAAPTTTTIPPPSVVATTKVANLQVFDAPNGTKVVTTLSARTDYRQPRTLLVTEQQPGWLKTLLPIRPNGSSGWVRDTDVTLSESPYKIKVDLSDHHLWMWKDGEQVLDTPVVIGRPSTPTPLGIFYITDPVDLRANPNTAYGAYAIGLSGFSEVLFEFNGGPGQIAIHGTPTPQDVGKDLSNGCVRMPNDMILEIAKVAPLGTPVEIVD